MIGLSNPLSPWRVPGVGSLVFYQELVSKLSPSENRVPHLAEVPLSGLVRRQEKKRLRQVSNEFPGMSVSMESGRGRGIYVSICELETRHKLMMVGL